jgi:hypothetical protein
MYSCTAMHRLTASQLGVRPQPFLPQHIDQQRLDVDVKVVQAPLGMFYVLYGESLMKCTVISGV